MYVGADAGVNAHGADVGAETAVTFDQIDGVLAALHQSPQIPVQVLLVAEHAAEVVAGAGGVGADGHIVKARRTADALVKGAVPAAGIDPQRLPGGRGLAYLAGGVHGGFGHIDLVCFLAAGKDLLRPAAHQLRLVLAAGGGIDDKQMFHFRSSPLLRYIKRSHLIMPLYSLRFLSAGRPKQRSNSVWEDSRYSCQFRLWA